MADKEVKTDQTEFSLWHSHEYRSGILCFSMTVSWFLDILIDLYEDTVEVCALRLQTVPGIVSLKHFQESYYAGTGISFFGVPALDLKHYPIKNYFQVRIYHC